LEEKKEANNKEMSKFENLKKEIEAILFSSGKLIDIEELVKLCKSSYDEVRKAANQLKEEYNKKDSSLMIIAEKDAWKLTVRERHINTVQKIVAETELSKSVMETLAVIAFKHPCLQSEIVKIRTNKAYEHLTELEEAGFITRQKYGRSKKIRLTPKFFEYFDLPPDKIREAFASFDAVEKTILDKEEEARILREELERKKRQSKEDKSSKPQAELETKEDKSSKPQAELETKEDKEKLGKLDVYKPSKQETEEEASKDVEIIDSENKLGNLEVVDELPQQQDEKKPKEVYKPKKHPGKDVPTTKMQLSKEEEEKIKKESYISKIKEDDVDKRAKQIMGEYGMESSDEEKSEDKETPSKEKKEEGEKK